MVGKPINPSSGSVSEVYRTEARERRVGEFWDLRAASGLACACKGKDPDDVLFMRIARKVSYR